MTTIHADVSVPPSRNSERHVFCDHVEIAQTG